MRVVATYWGAWILACGVAQAIAAEDPETIRAQEIVAQRCYRCHGETGMSTTSLFPKLAGQNVEYLTKQMFNFQTRARRSLVMEEQIAGLSGNDIEALARYFSMQESAPDPAADLSLSARGRALYYEGIPDKGVSPCVSCHGPTARGAQMLPRLAGQHASYIERQLHAFVARSRANDHYRMHMIARGLSAEDIRAVAHYLSGLE